MVKIVSFANNYHISGFVNFKNSLKKFKWKYQLIGKNEKWEGWITRIKAYLEFTKKSNKNDLLVLLDAYDVICLKDASDFENKFNQLKIKYVFGCEQECAESISCKKPHNWQKKHQIYDYFPNGGCIIARSKHIFELYDWCIKNNHTKDDQMALGHFMDAFPNDVYLDIHSTFVFNDTFGKRAIIEVVHDKKFYIKNAIDQPYFIHFPGLMISSSIPLQINIGKVPNNYITVTKNVLEDDAIYNLPIHNLYGVFLLIFYIVFILLFLVLLSFLIYYLVQYKQCDGNKK